MIPADSSRRHFRKCSCSSIRTEEISRDSLRRISYLCHVIRREWPPRACIATIPDVINMRFTCRHQQLFWQEWRACELMVAARRDSSNPAALHRKRNLRPSFKNLDDYWLINGTQIGHPHTCVMCVRPRAATNKSCFRTWNVVGHAHPQACTCTSAALLHGRHGSFRRRRRSLEATATGRRDWPITRGR